MSVPRFGRSSLLSCCAAGIALLASLVPAQAQLLAGEREADISAIPGVIAADAEWELVWADFVTADGILGTADGGVMFAQEQTDKIIKLNAAHEEITVVENTNGGGSTSIDPEGRIWTVQRTCTEPLNPELAGCNELTTVAIVYPERRVVANSFADGRSLGRVNDVITDGKGGAYFTSGGAYYVNAAGEVSTVAEGDIRSNGIMLSPDGRTLYVTNNNEVVAFDVRDDGSTANRRVFGSLNGDSGGDGMAIDSEGRLYVTAGQGVHVLSPGGDHLGVIPTKRRAITLTFSGPDKQYLYVPQMGAVGPDGKEWATPDGIRNTAMTIYRIPMQSRGFAGRAK